MNNFSSYVAGNFVQTGNSLPVFEKFSGIEFAQVSVVSDNHLEQAIDAAVNAESATKKLSAADKSEILQCIAAKLLEKKEYFAEIIAKEAGKPMKFARIEAERASQTFLIAAEETKRIHSERLALDWFAHGKGKEAIIRLFPIGLVAGITPFNFPLNLVAHKVAPAIAAGCPIILKPASATPISTLELAAIIHQSGLPKGAFSALVMPHSVGNKLVTDSRIKKLSFTGSQEVGWKMKANCGKKKITLELGGNAAAIVSQFADFDQAVAKCVTGAFAYSGQVCIHTQRIFVHKSVFNEFLHAFTEKTSQWKFGDPLNNNTDISVLIDEPNAIRVEHWIKEAVEAGAKCVLGGNRTGSFVQPTILTNTNNKMKVRYDEVFGPVVCIEPYDTFDEAIGLVNDSSFGLQAGVFTDSIEEMNVAYENIQAGGVLINESPTFRIDHMPYGGIKDSGFGREGIKYAIHEMCEMKVLLKPC